MTHNPIETRAYAIMEDIHTLRKLGRDPTDEQYITWLVKLDEIADASNGQSPATSGAVAWSA